MGAKAVYNNQSVMIYITGEHARRLLEHGSVICESYIGTHQYSQSGCWVELEAGVREHFLLQFQAERGAQAAIRERLRADYPELASSKSRRRAERRKRAKRALSTDDPGQAG